MEKDLIYKVALTLIPHVGDIVAKKLVAYCGGVEAVFKERKQALVKIPFIGEVVANAVVNQDVLGAAERECENIVKSQIKPLFFLDADYPRRLLHCEDSPVLLYYQGNADLNASRILSVVGTRRASKEGRALCKKIIEELDDVLIVSGLAYGIDTCSHISALDSNLDTVGVLAHGLDRLYPAQNKVLSENMKQNGGLLTEFRFGTNPDRENFPKRNRIVAGIADAVLVVESRIKGGSLITAGIANSYSRDVFAIPGNPANDNAKGCNWLIRTNRAALVESATHIKEQMGWITSAKNSSKNTQTKLFLNLSESEQKVVNVLMGEKSLAMDTLCAKAKMTTSQAAAVLLNLEFDGVVICHPGQRFSLVD